MNFIPNRTFVTPRAMRQRNRGHTLRAYRWSRHPKGSCPFRTSYRKRLRLGAMWTPLVHLDHMGRELHLARERILRKVPSSKRSPSLPLCHERRNENC